MRGFDQCPATQTQGLQRDDNRYQMQCSMLRGSISILLNSLNPRHPDPKPTGARGTAVLS